MSIFTKKSLNKSLSYIDYKNLAENLFVNGKSTSKADEYNTSEYLEHVKLNLQRMNRVERTSILVPELVDKLNSLSRKQIWFVLSESWCGDVAQNLPVLSLISDSTNNVELRVLLREENPEIMNAYLTKGGKAIPKMIAVDSETFLEIFQWGPRPKAAQELVIDMKAKGEDFHHGVHSWYAQDKSQTIQHELSELLLK